MKETTAQVARALVLGALERPLGLVARGERLVEAPRAPLDVGEDRERDLAPRPGRSPRDRDAEELGRALAADPRLGLGRRVVTCPCRAQERVRRAPGSPTPSWASAAQT